jgi:hypothetical protein
VAKRPNRSIPVPLADVAASRNRVQASDPELRVSRQQQIIANQQAMLWLLAISAASARAQPAIAQAVVRIEHPARATREDWGRQKQSQQHEVIVKDEAGNLVRLRLTEYQ